MKDFRREQFVIVDGSLKLSDVDDVVVGDPHCITAKDCVVQDSTKEAILASGEFCRCCFHASCASALPLVMPAQPSLGSCWNDSPKPPQSTKFA